MNAHAPIQEGTEAATEFLGLRHNYLFSEDPAAPLCFFVHGRAGTMRVMWTFRRALPSRVNVIAVQAPYEDPIGGYSWWLGMDAETLRERASAAASKLTRFVQESPRRYDLTPAGILAYGFSQGAAVLSVISQEEPKLLTGVALLAGFVIEREPVNGEYRPKIFMAHGSDDKVVSLESAQRGCDFLKGQGYEVEFHQDPVGHKVGASGVRQLTAWSARLVGLPHEDLPDRER